KWKNIGCSAFAAAVRVPHEFEEPMHLVPPSHRLSAIYLLSLGFLLASAGTATAVQGPRVPLALRAPVDPALKINQRFLSAAANGAQMVDLFIQGDVAPEVLRAKGIEVNTVAGGFLTARCPLGMVDQLVATPGIKRLKVSDRCKLYLDQSAVDIGLPSVRTVPPPDFTGQTGEG